DPLTSEVSRRTRALSHPSPSCYRWIIDKAFDLSRHGNDRLLDDVMGFGVREAGLSRDAINQTPVSVEEIMPTLTIFPVFQPAQQAKARRDQIVRFRQHD